MKLKDLKIEDAILILNSSNNIKEFILNIGQSISGNAYRRVNNYIQENNLNISHFKKDRWSSKEKSIEEVLKKDSCFSQKSLKNKIIKFKILEYKCEKCKNIGEWNNKKLILHLDHINGINTDNRIENLRFLCPNCHSQTDTYSGKNNLKLL